MVSPARLFIVGFEGTTAPPELRRRVQAGEVGGVILFKRNLAEGANGVDLDAVAALVRDLGEGPADQPPPFVSVDQEGGRVQRLRAPLTVWPPMARVATHEAEAHAVGQAVGAELRPLGFNLDFAPVLDVHTNPQNPIIGDRAFGTEPEAVARRALAFWRGLEDAGLRGCGKHYPGHGDTAQDSHLTLPRVDRPLEELRAVELLPFAAAARAGMGMLMTAHVVYPAVDDQPATLSRRWLRDILRDELGFAGVVLSDDLDMAAVATRDVGEVIVESLLCGCDAFLLCRDPDRQARAEEALRRAAERDPAVRARLEEAAARVQRFRQTLAPARPARTLRLPDEILRRHAALAERLRQT